ncbi:glucuronate isomerase [Chengkuizengella axinellae]|uniref:Uronate isomerase n=1 Tax=Chengkuizengella axinellae TaxID=3064388 RepID=A0ABT9ITI2_9BACL|nr:glucuronate isomerase [Chengkuizengella sp. 2205SS18-9]MDP5272623.1 glucuronate isomerase [Chengkuizengella sp. 2205SS18-9]
MTFLSEHMMLKSESAKLLFHDYAKQMPIIDFHTHLSPQEIAENKTYHNITELWLSGDHYKWRAMRWLGFDEKLITGEASDKEKFMTWAKTLPYTMGNPIYVWSHLELSRYFGIEELLTPENAEHIWEVCNEKLKDSSFSTQNILQQFNVKVINTTDDPIDSLNYHRNIMEQGNIATEVLPTFRPDQVLNIDQLSFKDYIHKMEQVTELSISNYSDLISAVENRIRYFNENGCRISDHAFTELPFSSCTEDEAATIFKKGIDGQQLSLDEIHKYQTKTMMHLGQIYNSLGWTMQLHIGAIRNNNSRMLSLLGKDTGYDSILDYKLAENLNGFLNELDKENTLPKTIVYTLNAAGNDVIASAIGNFQSTGARGKLQFGSGWWFNDTKEGMLNQMKTLANIGVLSTFIGMLTDSRSFLSFPRHEYFRRVLCDLFGGWIENGELPRDYEFIGSIIQDISYNNALNYFSK